MHCLVAAYYDIVQSYYDDSSSACVYMCTTTINGLLHASCQLTAGNQLVVTIIIDQKPIIIIIL